MDASTSDLPNSEGQAPSRLYALQVRAFLEAAEDVELDAETIEDILDGFEDVQVGTEDDTESESETAQLEDFNGEDTLEALSRELEEDELAEFSAEGTATDVSRRVN